MSFKSAPSGSSSSPASLSSATASSRFSLLLLEPNEIYFEDYLVYYSPNELAPFLSKSSPTTTTTTASATTASASIGNRLQKGNLKICSRSVVFEPIDTSYPLVKFAYKSMERIVRFDTDDDNGDDEWRRRDMLSSLAQRGALKRVDSARLLDEEVVRAKTFGLRVKQVTRCKANNRIAPYELLKSSPGPGPGPSTGMHYFQFIFASVADSLDLMCQLQRASTLDDHEQEDIMQQMIVKSRVARTAKFDMQQLEDVFAEHIRFEACANKCSPLVTNPGRVVLTNALLYYKPFNNLENERQLIKIKLERIRRVVRRRYRLKPIACEILYDENTSNEHSAGGDDESVRSGNGENGAAAASGGEAAIHSLPYLYLSFDDEQTCAEFYTRLVVEHRHKLTRLDEANKDNMLQKWRYGAISNFDYLMYLNNMADR